MSPAGSESDVAVGDGARCLAAAECSGVTVLVMGHDEQPQMKDEAWRILGRGAPLRPAPSRIPPLIWSRTSAQENRGMLTGSGGNCWYLEALKSGCKKSSLSHKEE
ncbi:Hypothetical predicted protein [Scomber scombrus]|uniref:Uncharacterized protein n=1 Tax=Scomber scombrus TaxID=13677 RepID=A0AAV1NCY5_SCOSC